MFYSHKIPISEWIEYPIHLFKFHSATPARGGRNTIGFSWIGKVFAALDGCQDGVVLSGGYGSRLIHDGDNSHSLSIERLGLSSEVHPTSETKGLTDSENPLNEVNGIHALLQRFLRKHGGYYRGDLMGWCSLF
ncbi:MAG: hypothetical protein SOV58_04250 [Candidatus Enteromonas sp.]|nr:hypothetical protein [Candidatus Enteromonas sp.]